MQQCASYRADVLSQRSCAQLTNLRDQCKSNDAAACTALARCFRNGWTAKADVQRAAVIARHACRLGAAAGCAMASAPARACKLRHAPSCAALAATAVTRAENPTAAAAHLRLLDHTCRDDFVATACKALGNYYWQLAQGVPAPGLPDLAPTPPPPGNPARSAMWYFDRACNLCNREACVYAAGITRAANTSNASQQETTREQRYRAQACDLGHKPACSPQQ